MHSKIVDPMILDCIQDNDIVAISGFNMATTPEYLIMNYIKNMKNKAIQKIYL